MEYLMTYSWAILLVSVALVALFALGVFNTGNFTQKALPGSCSVFRPNGPGTTELITLTGLCSGLEPQSVASFSGSSPSISISNVLQLGQISNGGGKSVTITAWGFNTNPLGSTQYNLIHYGGALECGSSQNNLEIFVEGTSEYSAYTMLQCANDGMGSTSIPTGRWVFYATAFDGSTDTGYVGYGGQLYSSKTTGITTVTLPSSPAVGIGDAGPFDTYWNGQMANVQIYDTVLSANEISALYKAGIGGDPIQLNNLAGWWPLNGNAKDYSGNDDNGTATAVQYTTNWQANYTTP
jgi:hypothetical protein